MKIPHTVKVNIVKEYAIRYNLQVFIETGTFRGDMVKECQQQFREIYTIELSKKLALTASKRLISYPNIHVICGDSAQELVKLLFSINEPVLFWLDGHYSGGVTARGSKETPLLEELRAISRHKVKNHTILIDDARMLGSGDYPSLEEITNILQINANCQLPRLHCKLRIISDIVSIVL